MSGSLPAKFAISLAVLCTLFVTIVIEPAVLADGYPEGDYLHHLWRLQEDAEREQKLYDSLWESERNASRFCAIAYSPTTFQWGYSWGKQSRQAAEEDAIAKSESPDAKILCWSKGSWYCALADGPDSYGAAPGETPEIAKAEAMRIANEHGSGNRIVLLVGGNPPIVRVWK
jgi:hypothetical protein